jgi:hypothetical protein
MHITKDAAVLYRLTPLVLPLACVWIERQQRIALARGLPLSQSEFADASAIGVRRPAKVRLLEVSRIPLPDGRLVRSIALATGLLSTQAAGLAVGYGILVQTHHWRERFLIVHELVHVMQYERLGGVRPFLRAYISECLRFGYSGASLELEAIAVTSRLTSDEPPPA